MSKRIKQIFLILSVVVISFVFSYFEINKVYFLLCIPFIMITIAYKSSCFIYNFIGMLLASFFLDKKFFPLIITISFSINYLVGLLLNKLFPKINLKNYLGIEGGVFALVLTYFQVYSHVTVSMINVIVIPLISYFVCYSITDLQFDLKSKEQFSLTRKQLTFLIGIIDFLFIGINFSRINFYFGFVVVMLLNYILMRTDSLLGIIGFSLSCIFVLPYDNQALIFSLIPFIFVIKPLIKKRYLSALAYLFLNIFATIYMKNTNYVVEFSLIAVFIAFLPDKFTSFIYKFIVEPPDYELKLYQKSYYRTLNNNKKIYKIMNMLEKQITKNPKMKKKNKNIILQGLQFLSEKLNEEEDIHLKDNILQDLKFRKANVLSCKILNDYLGNYTIYLEVRNSNIENEEIMQTFEDKLGVRLRCESYLYNRFVNIQKFIFVNEEKYTFNISIKQRSKDEKSCGDSYIRFSIKNKKYVLISDGMGHGKKASIESSEALLLLKSFIELGMASKDAILSCNALMCNKEEEKFNTLDLLEYDVFENRIMLYKNGSGSTYLKSDEGIKKINSENLPLGIIEDIRVEKYDIKMNTDYIVLTSDGIKKDITNLLSETKTKSAKGLSSKILENEDENIEDDQTIVVINVIKK